MGLPTIAATLCVSAVLAIMGCNEQQLKTVGQAESFISKVAKGDDPGNWKFAGRASAEPLAVAAWTHKREIADLGKRLREQVDAKWVCDTVGYVEKYGQAFDPTSPSLDPQTLSTGARMYIIEQERQKYDADDTQVAELIDLSLRVSKSELVKVADGICMTAEQL